MKRAAIVSLSWVLSIALTAGVTYWMTHQQISTIQVAPDLEIAQPLTEPQRQLLLRAPSVIVIKGMTVTLSEPGKPSQLFMVRGKLDLPDKPPKKKKSSPPLYNPFKKDKNKKKSKIPKIPNYVPYPCRMRDSTGKLVWGVCFRRKF